MKTKQEREKANMIAKKWYDKNKLKKRQYQLINKELIKEKKAKYYIENKEKMYAQKKIYMELNKEKIKTRKLKNNQKEKERKKNYYQKNKEKIKEYNRNRHKLKISTDPLFKLKKTIRTSIGEALRKKGFTKKSRSYIVLGCSFEELKLYIENKFESWMTWENHGKYNGKLNFGWDIDHITPLDTAKTEEDIIKLNHYSNLQPLCSYTNRHIKRNKKP